MYKVTLINGSVETTIHSPYFNELKLISGQIKQGINIADGFTFTITPNNPGYDLIKPLSTLVKVENMKNGKLEFDGRILVPTENMSESGVFDKSFICESELGYLNDSAQRHGEYHDISVKDFLQVMIDNHNEDVQGDSIDKSFFVGDVDVTTNTGTIYRYLGYESTWEAIKDKLIDRLGGEVTVRHENGLRYLDYKKELGSVKKTEIRLAKNLKSVSKEVDPQQVITKLIPLGQSLESENEEDTDASKKRLTIESVNNGLDYIVDEVAKQEFGIIAKSETWDDITQPNILKTRGQEFLQSNNRIKVKYQINALDLSLIGLDTDSFDVYNYYPLINPVMAINDELRAIGKTIDIIMPNNNSLEFGDHFKTASQYQYESNLSAKKVIALENTVDRQSQVIASIRNEVVNVESNLDILQQAIADADLEDLPEAIGALEQAINSLNDALDGIPIYGIATHTEDGLMASVDKIKLDALEVYQEATELTAGLMSADDKQKLNRITATGDIDLDNVLVRLNALENPQDP